MKAQVWLVKRIVGLVGAENSTTLRTTLLVLVLVLVLLIVGGAYY